MIAQCLTGETRPVIRHRRGVVWCPYCDRSIQDITVPLVCTGCNAVFKDDPVEPEPLPRRRRAANDDNETTGEPTDPAPE